jgi:hypothetical protein
MLPNANSGGSSKSADSEWRTRSRPQWAARLRQGPKIARGSQPAGLPSVADNREAQTDGPQLALSGTRRVPGSLSRISTGEASLGISESPPDVRRERRFLAGSFRAGRDGGRQTLKADIQSALAEYVQRFPEDAGTVAELPALMDARADVCSRKDSVAM